MVPLPEYRDSSEIGAIYHVLFSNQQGIQTTIPFKGHLVLQVLNTGFPEALDNNSAAYVGGTMSASQLQVGEE